MDVVLQAAVLGVGLLQSVLHVLQLVLVAALHLNETTLEHKLMCTTEPKAVDDCSGTGNVPPLCCAAAGSAQLWLCSAGSAGPTL